MRPVKAIPKLPRSIQITGDEGLQNHRSMSSDRKEMQNRKKDLLNGPNIPRRRHRPSGYSSSPSFSATGGGMVLMGSAHYSRASTQS